jgi:hypothetical protein
MGLTSDPAQPYALIFLFEMSVIPGAPDWRPGRQAGADGGCGVVADVVETPWTGGAIRDVARHRGA